MANHDAKQARADREFRISTEYLAIVLVNSLYIVLLVVGFVPEWVKAVAAIGLMATNLLISHYQIELIHSKDLQIYELISVLLKDNPDGKLENVKIKDLIKK